MSSQVFLLFLFQCIDRELAACELWFLKMRFREISIARLEDELIVMLRIRGYFLFINVLGYMTTVALLLELKHGWGRAWSGQLPLSTSTSSHLNYRTISDFTHVLNHVKPNRPENPLLARRSANSSSASAKTHPSPWHSLWLRNINADQDLIVALALHLHIVPSGSCRHWRYV